MAKFFLSNRAVEDLSSIWNYTCEKWSERQADLYYHLLINAFEKLVRNPGIGIKYFDIFPGLRGLKIGHHLVFYFVTEGRDVEIVRILHERMDVAGRMKEPLSRD